MKRGPDRAQWGRTSGRTGPTLAMHRRAPFVVARALRAALLEPVLSMTASTMTIPITRRLSGALFLCLIALAACNPREPKVARHRGLVLPPVDKSWRPESVTVVRGVPADSIRAAITKRLAGKAPSPLGKAAWDRTVDLYKKYAGSPLWLDAEGVRGERTAA